MYQVLYHKPSFLRELLELRQPCLAIVGLAGLFPFQIHRAPGPQGPQGLAEADSSTVQSSAPNPFAPQRGKLCSILVTAMTQDL